MEAVTGNLEAQPAVPWEPQPITPEAPQTVKRVAMRQTWRRLTFLHWPYEPSQVRPLLPTGLELDTFDGVAWVGLVPFEIHNLRGIPAFPETNVRTYVLGPDGSRAVWFFSLDAARLPAVVGARLVYHLPYFWARMQVTSERDLIRYRSRRSWPHARTATTNIAIMPCEPFLREALTERDHFLTARYRLYAASRGKLCQAQIEHAAWPLARANAVEVHQTLVQASGLTSPEGAPLVHYSAELDVKIGHLSTVRGDRSIQ